MIRPIYGSQRNPIPEFLWERVYQEAENQMWRGYNKFRHTKELNYAFDWTVTKEGYKFWCNIDRAIYSREVLFLQNLHLITS